eukprot:TRINITY_DN17640_c0_g1_i1.p1 TRINITY_DN17640_c0_g1~~TRINITY_DN17640_c0_g1_i1.p1  ORF type:complete len:684 (+),score=9.83 TRINITY_DN17640_c0_g1_i1:93-2144(+)
MTMAVSQKKKRSEKMLHRLLMAMTFASFLFGIAGGTWYPLGLDAAVAKHMKSDPLATKDTLAALPQALRKSLARPSHSTIAERIAYLKSLEILMPVHVKLVGFSRDDRWQIQSHISKFIEALHSDEEFYVIGGGDSHKLIPKSKLSVDVSTADSRLADRILEAIKANMERSSPVMRSHLHSVPYSVVDSLIRADLEPESAYTVYLLNVPSQEKPYAYSYESRDSSASFAKCLGSIWTGKERYVWVDLAAGPVEYGPSLSGEGVLPRGEFHPLAALHKRSPNDPAFFADLASLVWSASQLLFRPALRIPTFLDVKLYVHFIHLHSAASVDVRGLDWNAIESTFLSESKPLLFDHQSLQFRRYSVGLSKCSLCVSAVSRATRSYTSRFLFENYTMLVSEYLDSKSLRYFVSEIGDEIAKSASVPAETDPGRVLPVYVFDLDMDRPLLLDRFHQAVAFKDMVIAVRTWSSQSMMDYSCNGRHIIMQARSLERPIVGALLQSLWGVSPTHLTWSPRHNNTLVDYTWSVGQTPFGPFTEMTSLSFVQTDSARRNVLLTTLNASVSSALDVFQSVAQHGGEKKVLGPRRHVEFIQRWNLLRYKIDKALSSISHFDFNEALYCLKSSDFDLFEIHNLFYLGASELEVSLVCFRDPPFPWASALSFVVIVVAFCFVWSRRDRLFRSKIKRF